jgi:hypothetical protein
MEVEVVNQESLWGARARVSDPVTSHLAARSVSNTMLVQERIVALYRRFGAMTDEELCAMFDARPVWASPSSIRSRRAELVAAGVVVNTGRRRRTVSGRQAIVWDISDTGAEPGSRRVDDGLFGDGPMDGGV